jgi:hypothetical protein
MNQNNNSKNINDYNNDDQWAFDENDFFETFKYTPKNVQLFQRRPQSNLVESRVTDSDYEQIFPQQNNNITDQNKNYECFYSEKNDFMDSHKDTPRKSEIIERVPNSKIDISSFNPSENAKKRNFSQLVGIESFENLLRNEISSIILQKNYTKRISSNRDYMKEYRNRLSEESRSQFREKDTSARREARENLPQHIKEDIKIKDTSARKDARELLPNEIKESIKSKNTVAHRQARTRESQKKPPKQIKYIKKL